MAAAWKDTQNGEGRQPKMDVGFKHVRPQGRIGSLEGTAAGIESGLPLGKIHPKTALRRALERARSSHHEMGVRSRQPDAEDDAWR